MTQIKGVLAGSIVVVRGVVVTCEDPIINEMVKCIIKSGFETCCSPNTVAIHALHCVKRAPQIKIFFALFCMGGGGYHL